MPQTPGERIKYCRKALGYTIEYVAERLGINKSTLSRWESGDTQHIQIGMMKRLADVLLTTAGYLSGYDDPVNGRIRILGSIHCGEPVWAEETYDEYLNTTIKCDFALRAVGDSMINAGIYDGDMVLVRSQDTADNRQIAVVCIGDDSTLKRVIKKGDRIISLRPENPAYDDIFLDELDDPASVRIMGVAVAVQHIL